MIYKQDISKLQRMFPDFDQQEIKQLTDNVDKYFDFISENKRVNQFIELLKIIDPEYKKTGYNIFIEKYNEYIQIFQKHPYKIQTNIYNDQFKQQMENLFEYTSLVRLEKVLPLVYPGVIDYLIKLIYRIFEYEPNQVEKFILLLKKKDIGGNTGQDVFTETLFDKINEYEQHSPYHKSEDEILNDQLYYTIDYIIDWQENSN